MLFRDDGPLSRAIGRTLGPRLRVNPMAPLTLGPLGALAFAFIAGEDASLGVTAAGVASHALSCLRSRTSFAVWREPVDCLDLD